jgi:DNA modification methylase
MKNLEITYLSLGSLTPANRNARTHSRKQIGQIADSLKTFGWTNPVLISDEGKIVAGHGRVEAAKLLGMAEVPTIRLSKLNREQCRIYALADNRLAELAGWDRNLLALELGELCKIELDIDVELTGFEMAEIDVLLDEAREPDSADNIPEVDTAKPPVTRPGDIWMLGEHRLICGDALEDVTYQSLMRGALADLVFCDPPYNVPINGHVSGLGKVQHREFAMASGEMTEQEFIAFLTAVFQLLAKHGRDGSISFQCIDWRHLYEMLTAGRQVYTELKNLCVWAKSNGGMGSLYRSRHELICVFKRGTAPHSNNVELGRFGRNRTNVWEFDGMSSVGAARDEALALHPTVKPVALVADAVLDCSNRGGIVLDAFLGSRTTLLAAERTGRKCFGIEIDPVYVDVAVCRWEKFTKKVAVLESCGRSFIEMSSERRSPESTEV